MKTIPLRRHQGPVICENCFVADRAPARLKGLLGRDGLGQDEGLLLRPASAVHTFFMQFPIDVVFLDRDLTVLGIENALAPWRMAGRKGSKAVLELAAGEAARVGLEVGERLELARPAAA